MIGVYPIMRRRPPQSKSNDSELFPTINGTGLTQTTGVAFGGVDVGVSCVVTGHCLKVKSEVDVEVIPVACTLLVTTLCIPKIR
jgi:hypothetical protein